MESLPTDISATDVFRQLSALPHAVFFDNCDTPHADARYSFVAVDPFEWISVPADGSDALSRLESALAPFSTSTHPGLPPFQGGAAGVFGYELALGLEDLAQTNTYDLSVPAMSVGLYDLVIAFDHQLGKGWLISQGFPELDPNNRQRRAQSRMDQLKAWLAGPASSGGDNRFSPETPLDVAPQFDVGIEGVTSNMSADDYLDKVAQEGKYIHQGDVFQVNLEQRLL